MSQLCPVMDPDYQILVRQTSRQHSINNIQSQLPEDAVLPIKFKRYNSSLTVCVSADDDQDILSEISSPLVLTAQETISEIPRAELLSNRKESTVLISQVLCRMDVPVLNFRGIIKQIFWVLESANTMQPIHVKINRITHRLQYIRDGFETIERVRNASMDTYEVKLVPASKSFIKDVERVTLDDSEDADESCVICMECFEGGFQVIRLPCSHIFHEECGEKWLTTSHLCPLCRYPMPSEED